MGRNKNDSEIPSVEFSQAGTETALYLAACFSGLTMNCCSLMTKLGISEFVLYKQMIEFPPKCMLLTFWIFLIFKRL